MLIQGVFRRNSTKTIKTQLLFLNNNTTIKTDSTYNYKIRANTNSIKGIDTPEAKL